MNKGFTLIELLVVVLIIGILAAIALPQYTKAVERSRMAEAVQKLGDLATAESIYYMQENDFATLANLNDKGDITFAAAEFPATAEAAGSKPWYFTITPAEDKTKVVIKATRKGGMFGGAELSIRVANTGAITKECTKAVGDSCKVAQAMGYGSGTQGSAL